ncbi:MAG: IPExxxVDY family protein [Bacteroidota bacterium]|nr:IPExxxVDY family protein [uncultured Allomuricauda sp.]
MSATYKISEAYYENDFQLIAIHSGMEDFSLAYFLNRNCSLYLRRTEKDLQGERSVMFSIFDWTDLQTDSYWVLFSNMFEEEVGISEGFFTNDVSIRTSFLVPEQKEVDYFLKIDSENKSLVKNTVKAINDLPRVVTAYALDTTKLKSTSNLIY